MGLLDEPDDLQLARLGFPKDGPSLRVREGDHRETLVAHF
jgi:hypothetical protein